MELESRAQQLTVSGCRRLSSSSTSSSFPTTWNLFPDLYYALPDVYGPSGVSTIRTLYQGANKTTVLMQTGKFRLTWTLPEDVNADSLRAEYKNGCLVVKATKKNVLSFV